MRYKTDVTNWKRKKGFYVSTDDGLFWHRTYSGAYNHAKKIYFGVPIRIVECEDIKYGYYSLEER